MGNPKEPKGKKPKSDSAQKDNQSSSEQHSSAQSTGVQDSFDCDEDFFLTPVEETKSELFEYVDVSEIKGSTDHPGSAKGNLDHSQKNPPNSAKKTTNNPNVDTVEASQERPMPGKNNSLQEVMDLIQQVEQESTEDVIDIPVVNNEYRMPKGEKKDPSSASTAIQSKGVSEKAASRQPVNSPEKSSKTPVSAQSPTQNPVKPPNNAHARAKETTAVQQSPKKRGKTLLGKSNDKSLSNMLIRNRFELKRKVGVGGMGTVYKAVDQIMVEAQDKNPFVAVKILREELKSNKEAFQSLQREYRKSLKLAHPNIVQVYDFDRQGELIYMTMEFLQGKDLQRVFKKFKGHGIEFEKAYQVIEGICDALIHAHKNHIIHYDFKPGNIFITNTGVAKVYDFGISRAVKDQFEHANDELGFQAKSFTALTPTYASPEMIEGLEPSIKDDIFALGIVTYEMLAGKHPFDRKPANEARDAGMTPTRIKGLSSRQWTALRSALLFSREARLSSVAAFKVGILERISSREVHRRTLLGALFIGVAAFQVIAITLSTPTDDVVVQSSQMQDAQPQVPSPSKPPRIRIQ